MKPLFDLFRMFRLALAAMLALSCSLAAAATAPSAAPAAAGTNALARQEIPKSVFVIPASPKEGRNPFFPYTQPSPSPRPGPGVPDGLILNGITSPPKPTAMINSRTFEVGESGEVRLPGGAKVLIKCEEIRNDSCVISVDGQRRELHLRFAP